MSSSSTANNFPATSQLHIHAIGYDDNQALIGKSLENITVYRVDTGELEYTSVRLKRSSNSCALVRGSDVNGPPLIATIYRWGPGRHPRMRIFPADTSATVEEAINSDSSDGDLVDVKGKSIFNHTQKFETPLGTFEWRDGSKQEKAASNATTLMIMERLDIGKDAIPVAQFVRNPEFRTAGTKKGLAGEGGSGGRLLMNLTSWRDQKVHNEDVEAFMVASCLCMLKKEADRFQAETQVIYTGGS
ncbi:hypothetical protein K461DRAFT_275463 [Myriangium duriaei CBS 260.36]|uniref:Uncharacterized protein n=1 Tax=Myriangium duriaei CBS 260.36 TaxID=1168546 RepID=A0A9P4MKI1_9PEZI|nr:hypothetical protein K461DRAFT_275463 [Myriangium duriaei CBS 260.36]